MDLVIYVPSTHKPPGVPTNPCLTSQKNVGCCEIFTGLSKAFCCILTVLCLRSGRSEEKDHRCESWNVTVLQACKTERRFVYLSYLSYLLPQWCCSSLWSPGDREKHRQTNEKWGESKCRGHDI